MEPRTAKVSLAELPDTALALRVQEGDRDAANVLYRRYWPMARAIADDGGIWDGSEDLYADVFLACVAPGRFDPARGHFHSYLRKAMTTEVQRAHHRRRRSSRPITTSFEQLCEHGDGARYAELYPADLPDDERALVRAAIGDLIREWEAARLRRRERQRWAAIARLLYLEDQSYAETAARLGSPTKSIHNCLQRHIQPAIARRVAGVLPLAPAGPKEREAGPDALLEP